MILSDILYKGAPKKRLPPLFGRGVFRVTTLIYNSVGRLIPSLFCIGNSRGGISPAMLQSETLSGTQGSLSAISPFDGDIGLLSVNAPYRRHSFSSHIHISLSPLPSLVPGRRRGISSIILY